MQVPHGAALCAVARTPPLACPDTGEPRGARGSITVTRPTRAAPQPCRHPDAGRPRLRGSQLMELVHRGDLVDGHTLGAIHRRRSVKVAVVGVLAESMVSFRGDMLREMVAHGHTVLALAPEDDATVRATLATLGVSYASVPLQRAGLNPMRDACHRRRARPCLPSPSRPDAVLTYAAKPVIYGSIARASGSRAAARGDDHGVGSALGGGEGLEGRRPRPRSCGCCMPVGSAAGQRRLLPEPGRRATLPAPGARRRIARPDGAHQRLGRGPRPLLPDATARRTPHLPDGRPASTPRQGRGGVRRGGPGACGATIPRSGSSCSVRSIRTHRRSAAEELDAWVREGAIEYLGHGGRAAVVWPQPT